MEKRGGICEAQLAVALLMVVAESPSLPFAKRCQAGRLWWQGGLKRLGDDGQVGEECCLTSLKCLDLGRLPWS